MAARRADVFQHAEVRTDPDRDSLTFTLTLWAQRIGAVRRQRDNRHVGSAVSMADRSGTSNSPMQV